MGNSGCAGGGDGLVEIMMCIKSTEARQHFSEIVSAAEAGEDVVICRLNSPIVRLLRCHAFQAKQRNIQHDPALSVILAPSYNPCEPLSEEEWSAALQ